MATAEQKSPLEQLLNSHNLAVEHKDGLVYAVSGDGVFYQDEVSGDFCYKETEHPYKYVDELVKCGTELKTASGGDQYELLPTFGIGVGIMVSGFVNLIIDRHDAARGIFLYSLPIYIAGSFLGFWYFKRSNKNRLKKAREQYSLITQTTKKGKDFYTALEQTYEQQTPEKYANIINLIKPEYHHRFVHFVETGEASKELREYIEKDSDASNAVELAFQKQASAFEVLAKDLKHK